jgi:hypothetical protein
MFTIPLEISVLINRQGLLHITYYFTDGVVYKYKNWQLTWRTQKYYKRQCRNSIYTLRLIALPCFIFLNLRSINFNFFFKATHIPVHHYQYLSTTLSFKLQGFIYVTNLLENLLERFSFKIKVFKTHRRHTTDKNKIIIINTISKTKFSDNRLGHLFVPKYK